MGPIFSPKVTSHKQKAFWLFNTSSQALQLVSLTKIYIAIIHSQGTSNMLGSHLKNVSASSYPPILTVAGNVQVQQHTLGHLPHIKHLLTTTPQKASCLIFSVLPMKRQFQKQKLKKSKSSSFCHLENLTDVSLSFM